MIRYHKCLFKMYDEPDKFLSIFILNQLMYQLSHHFVVFSLPRFVQLHGIKFFDVGLLKWVSNS